MEWINGLAWPWGLLLGAGAGTVLVAVFGIIPLLLLDERKYARTERFQRMEHDARLDALGLSKKELAKAKMHMKWLIDNEEVT